MNPTTATSWRVSDDEIDLSRGALAAVVNVTPDSFSDGGEHAAPDAAIAHGLAMIEDGAVLVDVGGESTRPGAGPVSEREELRRVMPVIEGLVSAGIRVSVDTYKPGVARAALESGAAVINDVTGFTNPEMVSTVADSRCGVVIMHMKGTPADMHLDPRYGDVVAEAEAFLLDRVERLTDAGIDRSRVVIDPGIGFGKRPQHSIELLGNVARLAGHGLPVMIGTSRKGFLGELVGDETTAGRDQATAVTTALGYASGARVFRVHDVSRSRDALRIAAAIVAGERWDAWLQG